MKLNADQTVVVSTEVYCQPMDTCPRGKRVQVLGPGDCATETIWDGKDDQWQGWAEFPRKVKRQVAA